MRSRVSRVLGPVALVPFLFAGLVSSATAQQFTAREPASVSLGNARVKVNKVPPRRDVVRTEDGRARYIVRLADEPLAAYRGGVDGLAATSPSATGAAKLDATSAASQAYRAFLAEQQAAFVGALGAAAPRGDGDRAVRRLAERLLDRHCRPQPHGRAAAAGLSRRSTRTGSIT